MTEALDMKARTKSVNDKITYAAEVISKFIAWTLYLLFNTKGSNSPTGIAY